MFNQVILIGNIGKDPEVKVLPSGAKIVEFSLATTKSRKNKEGNWDNITQWHNIFSFDKFIIEKCEKYIRKGSKCQVTGEIEYNNYEKDGIKKSITKINISHLISLDKKEKTEGGEKAEVEMLDDEIDF